MSLHASKKPKYYLNSAGEFVIENYNYAKPFANFFPGIAGKYGIPMWVFYVNRAQGIVSFGTKDKEHSILEFYPANKAWQLAPSHGFRTFIKIIKSAAKSEIYEPFHNGFVNLNFSLSNKMRISSAELNLEEKNLSLGLEVKVEYFNIPNDSYAGLARVLTIKNSSGAPKKMQLLDGLPQIVPFGTSNLFLKNLSRTIEAWMNVKNLNNNVPFFKLDVDPSDQPEIVYISKGNFYLAFHQTLGKAKIIKPIIDPEHIFGPARDFSCPHKFLTTKRLTTPKNQFSSSKTPCSFGLLDLELKKGEEKSLFSVIGYARSLPELNDFIVKRITSEGYLGRKREENKLIISDLQENIDTKSSSSAFDLYAKQTYLDNILRGGYPIIFGQDKDGQKPRESSQPAIFYLYSRKHGDLERDYNKFHLEPEYFSQGNGNYRDANQNRRCDTWFNPGIKDNNLVYFLNLIQTDGFNPLVIKGSKFVVADDQVFCKVAGQIFEKSYIPQVLEFTKKTFTPGSLVRFIQENNLKAKVDLDSLLDLVLSHSLKQQEAEYGEGFWTDHWTYNLDLLESYLATYPEKLKEISFEKNVFTFYDSEKLVRPRNQKYLLYNKLPRQLHSVTTDQQKLKMINERPQQPNVVRTDYGKGEIYETTLINKLFCLLVNKLSSLDPFGVGIEMEANKPNWYDSLNGLPALFGSSVCETMELKRLILTIKDLFKKSQVREISLTDEIRELLCNLGALLAQYFQTDSPERKHDFWEKSYSLKEEYRAKTKFGLSGAEAIIDYRQLEPILNNALKKVESGINKAFDKTKYVYNSYFMNEVTDYQTLEDSFIKPIKFKQTPLPLFLEGQMHALRLNGDKQTARKLYQATKKSKLYDKKLKMYKVTASLSSMPEEIGRCRIFTPGWLENESIWLHMEYKYLLEILKQGLFEEFYAEFKNLLIPFHDPARYGRSILENSSFLVSSAFPDKKLHGNGFVARLSGSTAEFVQIWLIMNLGREPFFLDKQNNLNLSLRPALPGWLFDKKGNYSFNFLSKIRINYHNPKRKNTFGKNASKVKRIVLHGEQNPVELFADTIPSPYAEEIRNYIMGKIDVYFT